MLVLGEADYIRQIVNVGAGSVGRTSSFPTWAPRSSPPAA